MSFMFIIDPFVFHFCFMNQVFMLPLWSFSDLFLMRPDLSGLIEICFFFKLMDCNAFGGPVNWFHSKLKVLGWVFSYENE